MTKRQATLTLLLVLVLCFVFGDDADTTTTADAVCSTDTECLQMYGCDDYANPCEDNQ